MILDPLGLLSSRKSAVPENSDHIGTQTANSAVGPRSFGPPFVETGENATLTIARAALVEGPGGWGTHEAARRDDKNLYPVIFFAVASQIAGRLLKYE